MEEAFITEDISDEEKELASELRRLCDRFGIEMKDKLHESGRVLLKMGMLYLDKAEKCREAMLQKLTYIRASALLNGAKVRFQSTKSIGEIAEAKNDIAGLYRSLLLSAGLLGHRSGDLEETVSELKNELKHLREKAELEIEDIPVINEAVQCNEKQMQRERRKIERVKVLNQSNTVEYKKLMTFLTERIIEMLGPPPCEFAIAGLGSLAREEVTLYSDFEHVILLDDEIERLSEEEKLNVKEYYRWFAVIFQIIIIGLGETFIRSVGVKSINDLSSDDKSRNWFLDYYTPCAMAFDGMVPHSCNTPLGRQEPTEMKKHSVELIQSASKMAGFLRDDEALKNGYYLDDLLKGTCLVYGSSAVYKMYCKKRDKILDCQTVDEIVDKERKRITDNVNDELGKFSYAVHISARQDVKASLYRPVTVLVSCYGRANDVRVPSSFDIVTCLRKKEIWTVDFCHRVEYAIAVACEARLKSYMEAGQERNNATMVHWQTRIGIHGITECKCVIVELKTLFPEWTPGSDIAMSMVRVSCMAFAGFNKDVINEGTKTMDGIRKNHIGEAWTLDKNWCVIYLQCANHVQRSFAQYGLHETELQQEYLSKAVDLCEEILTRLDELPEMNHKISVPLTRMECYDTLVRIYHTQRRYRESSEFATKWFEVYQQPEKWSRVHRQGTENNVNEDESRGLNSRTNFISAVPLDLRHNVNTMRFIDLNSRDEFMDKKEFLKYLESELKRETVTISRLFLRCYIALQFIAIGDVRSGRKELLSVLLDSTRLTSPADKPFILMLLHTIRKEQDKHLMWDFDVSVTVIEEYELTKNDVHVRNSVIAPKAERKMDALQKDYEVVCEWRRAWNVPLNNSELNILEDYEKYSPSLREEIYQEIGLFDCLQDPELKNLITTKPDEFFRRLEPLFQQRYITYAQKKLHEGRFSDFDQLYQHYAAYLPIADIQNHSDLHAACTSYYLRDLYDRASLYLHQRRCEEAAKVLWRIINRAEDDVKEKSIHTMFRIICARLK